MVGRWEGPCLRHPRRYTSRCHNFWGAAFCWHMTPWFWRWYEPGSNELLTHDGSMVLLYMVTWIPSIYPSHVCIYTSTMDPMGSYMVFFILLFRLPVPYNLHIDPTLNCRKTEPTPWTMKYSICMVFKGCLREPSRGVGAKPTWPWLLVVFNCGMRPNGTTSNKYHN